MQYEDYIAVLNPKQLEAVESPYQYLRIVAGAGSGKTRVLTYRISYLISQLNVKPWEILAITFTNKVAAEMKKRVVDIVGESKYLTIRTFHSFAAMFLRSEIQAIDFPTNFTILDEEDQTKLVKDLVANRGYRKSDPLVKKVLNYIGYQKQKEKYPADITIQYERFPDEKLCLAIYEEYEEYKNLHFALDFDDLLLRTNQILSSFPGIRAKWQDKFSHILVDEFQDTNDTEYKMLTMLMKPSTSLYVVGDPDQTIYTWRGANQEIIVDLNKKYPDLETIILNQNYRSTQNILDSANKLISNNKFRVPKDLFTNNTKGNGVIVRCSDSPISEASYVAKEIEILRNVYHYKYSDIAILYRSNYLTLEFEKALMAKSIPYVIYGSVKFYQRMEIKDVLAYFHIISNPLDDISFERIINVPRRNIGEKTVNTIKIAAQETGMSLYQYIKSDKAESELPAKALNSLRAMIKRVEITKEELKENTEIFSKTLEDLITDIGYYDYLKQDEDGEDRIDNVKSLFDDIRHFLKANPESNFEEYLQNVALVSAQDDMRDLEKVTLMTVHTAKGLEYPVVFVVKLNQGVFPNNRAIEEGGFKGMEEERRLCYVAMTRAKERLYLTLSNGFSYVNKSELSPSQFLKESGNPVNMNSYTGYVKKPTQNKYKFDDVKEHKSFFSDEVVRQDFSQLTNDVSGWEIGDIVLHDKLGRGIVVAVEDDDIIKVDFDEHGKKTILGSHPMVHKGTK